jgi:glycosyltransferase involved in cell wall biosynthesis
MMLGRPIIATSGSGFVEAITDGVDGLLVPPGDAAALTDACITALSDPVRLEKLGAAARDRAADFTVDGMASRLLKVYGQLVA